MSSWPIVQWDSEENSTPFHANMMQESCRLCECFCLGRPQSTVREAGQHGQQAGQLVLQEHTALPQLVMCMADVLMHFVLFFDNKACHSFDIEMDFGPDSRRDPPSSETMPARRWLAKQARSCVPRRGPGHDQSRIRPLPTSCRPSPTLPCRPADQDQKPVRPVCLS